jgi:hypothetical protein
MSDEVRRLDEPKPIVLSNDPDEVFQYALYTLRTLLWRIENQRGVSVNIKGPEASTTAFGEWTISIWPYLSAPDDEGGEA